MVRIAVFDQNIHLLDKTASHTPQTGITSTTTLDGENLSAWMAKHGVDMLVLRQKHEETAPTTGNQQSEISTDNRQALWRLDSSQLELISPSGKRIRLSLNECCILKAAIEATGNQVSRKRLIEALGQHFLHYDERRLESLISRLRRKLASCSPEDFPIRSLRGQGYLFGARLENLEL